MPFSLKGHVALVTGSSDKSVRLWDLATGKPRHKEYHMEGVTALAVNPDDNTIATGSADGTVRLWDSNLRSMKPALVPQAGPVRIVAFSPGGKLLLTVSRDRKQKGETVVQLWVSSSGQSLATLNHPYWVRAVAFSPVRASARSDLIGRMSPAKIKEREARLIIQ